MDSSSKGVPHQPALTEIYIDAVSFMGTGPGRFANGAMSPLADAFMLGRVFQSTGVRQEFSLSDVARIVTPDADPTKPGFFSLQQYNFSDSMDDHALRTYIYNSSTFRISKDAVFVIEADGTRHIENYAILPANDNFDVLSNDTVAKYANAWLEPRVDPSGIGRRVDIKFDQVSKNQIPRIDYTQALFARDIQPFSDTYSPISGFSRLAYEMPVLVGDLWSSGVIQFLDGGKPILYGTVGADHLRASRVDYMPTLKDYAANGVVLMGGAGADHLIGGPGDDIFRGGAGADTYYSGAGHDKIIDEDNTGSKIVYKRKAYDLFGGGLFIRKDPSTNLWQTPAGKLTLSHNSPWMLQDGQGGSLELGATVQEGDFGIHMLDAIQDEPTYAVVSVTVKTNYKGEPVSVADPAPTDTSESIFVSGDKSEVNGRGGADILSGEAGDDRLYADVHAEAMNDAGLEVRWAA